MQQPEVVVYGTATCPYCAAARRLLDGRGVRYREIDVGGSASKRQEMERKSGRYTVPQIFIGQRHVGGFDDLAALERTGELARLLRQQA